MYAGSFFAALRRVGSLVVVVSITWGCSILDVNNPNNVTADALDLPSSATAQAIGVNANMVRALASTLGPYGVASDELFFTGSQDYYGQLDRGNISQVNNQFVGNAFTQIGSARWQADFTLGNLLTFDKEGRLANRADLANTYRDAAIVYMTIADIFDDFPIGSDRDKASQSVGENNMAVLYDTAIVYLDRGLVVANALNSAALRTQLTALRARARFTKGVWNKIKPGRTVPVDPLVNDGSAVSDAQAALALMGAADFAFVVTPTLQGIGNPNVGGDLNQRREFRIQCGYAAPACEAIGAIRTNVTTLVNGQPVITLNDPVSGQPDLALRNIVRAAIQPTTPQLLPMTVVSAREMHLIIAEAALARADLSIFRTSINTIRAFSAMSAWDGASPVSLTALQLLKHTRRTNLFLQWRRLQDMARFGEKDPQWLVGSTLATKAVCFFQIPEIERLSAKNFGVTIAPAACQ